MIPTSDLPTDLLAVLRRLAEALPSGSIVPVPREWLLAVIQGNDNAGVPPNASADLSPHDLAKLFGRSATTVRGWIERGEFPGAYKLRGKAWRVPRGAVSTFIARQSREADDRPGASRPAGLSLSDWRTEGKR